MSTGTEATPNKSAGLISKLLGYLHPDRFWFWLISGIVIISLSALLSLMSFRLVRRLTLFNQTGSFGANPEFSSAQATESVEPGESVEQVQNPIAPAVEPELVAWDGVGRVTVLLLGLDYRDWEAGNEYSRSDTMILLTLDPLTRTAGILSIPRDLWVAIPGFKHGKINTGYYLGDAYKLPGGGPGLAIKTVEEFLGVPIHYYAQIDFGAFVQFIDEIGGVKIDVPEAITIDLLGAGAATKKTLQPGIQVLPGEWALAYARARYTEGGDFDRARRQQQVILAIRDRILSLDMLSVLVNKADVLYRQLASGIHTNMSLDEAIKLAVLASQVPENQIQRGVIDKNYVIFGRSPDNLSILIPLTDKIHVLRDEIFASSGALTPLTSGNAQEKMASESAVVLVYNGSGAPELDVRTATYLQSMGVNAVASGAAETIQTLSEITDFRGRPFTTAFLVDQLGINPLRVMYGNEPPSEADLKLIVGNDWAQSNLMP